MNRQQKRAAEAQARKNGAQPDAPAPAPKVDDRIERLINGDLPPPNDFVKYLAEKAKGSYTEMMSLQNGIAQMEAQLNSARQQHLRLQGQVNKYVEDIRAWDKPLDAKSQPETKPEPKPAAELVAAEH